MNINYYIFGQPMFYQQHIGWLTLLARRMYGPTVDCLDKEDGFMKQRLKVVPRFAALFWEWLVPL